MADSKWTIDAMNTVVSEFSKIAQSVAKDGSLKGTNAEALLKSINDQLRNISRGMSQSAARDSVSSHFSDAYKSGSNNSSQQYYGGFAEEFKKGLIDSLAGSEFKSIVGDSLEGLAKQLGVDVSQVTGKLGQELGKQAMGAFKQSGPGKVLAGQITKISQATGQVISSLGTAVTGGGASGLAGAFGSLAAAALPLVAAFVALSAIANALAPGLQGIMTWVKTFGKSMNRYEESRKKNLELAQKRLEADVRSMIQAPFDILKEAAESVYQAWDNNVRLINGTQGYSKADLQSLMGAFAERLRSEGLSSVVSATSITESLADVLKSGLSGKLAEEFAYQAAVLNAAIPTQNFFEYASTYSSIAANAVKNGLSQQAAIESANKSLREFSNNVLYASRELSGGFSTGLVNASSLYEQAVKITQAGRAGSVNQVSGVLTAVAGIVGAIAPDLATSLTDTVYQAAVGGNSNNLVALRSLAGINASNTEFLRALATNPKQVYSNIFRNLATMFGSGGNAFMEKAEGYAEIFGLSSEAFQRIDFNYLAQAISKMNTDSSSLNDNLLLLQSGQTTQTKEQHKIAQINKYLIEEGLSYVLDNQVARSIQEHMWEEQIAREMMEAEYGVHLKGAALEALEGIKTTVVNLLNLLNPKMWFRKLADGLNTGSEGKALTQDIQALLRAGVVGSGNKQAFYNLTERNRNLNLTSSILELFGVQSEYQAARMARESYRNTSGLGVLGLGAFGLGADFHNEWFNQAYSGPAHTRSGVSSKYRWGILGKSFSGLSSLRSRSGNNYVGGISRLSGLSPTDASSSYLASIIQGMLTDSYLAKYIENGGYEAWKSSARGKGISDFDAALSSAGYSESEIRNYFQAKETEAGMQMQAELQSKQKEFYDRGIEFWGTSFWDNYSTPLNSLLQAQAEMIEKQFNLVQSNQEAIDKSIQNQTKSLTNWWGTYKSYYIDHKIYGGEALQLQALREVQRKENGQKGDVVNALSEYLTSNNWNIDDLKDPQVQANAILSQILVVLNAIMNQNNSTVGTMSLQDSLSALSLGVI